MQENVRGEGQKKERGVEEGEMNIRGLSKESIHLENDRAIKK